MPSSQDIPPNTIPYEPLQDRLPTTDDTPAFAASPPSVPPPPVQTPSPTSLSPTSTRKCEGCAVPHTGTYGSGRFCSANCAKKVGARHKWAARAATAPGVTRRTSAARRTIRDSPCESCSKLHDKSYGSGRFCSVHCARRVAATRKWEKSRTEKSKRLEAIRPAMPMLAPPPQTPPCPLPILTGKRRRVVDRHLEQLHISETGTSFYVTQPYNLPQRLDFSAHRPPQLCTPPPQPSTSPMIPVPAPPLQGPYIPPHAHASPIQYAQPVRQLPPGLEVPFITSQLVYTSHDPATVNTSVQQGFCYGYSNIPAYSLHHPGASPVDSASHSAISPSPTPSPSPITNVQHPPSFQYPPVSVLHQRPLPSNYILTRAPAFETETVSSTASPARVDEAATSVCEQTSQLQHVGKKLHMSTSGKRDKPAIDTSEGAARALLCLRENSS